MMRVAVLASGNGSNLQAILDRVHGNSATVVCVASDKQNAKALERAAKAGVETATFTSEDFAGDRQARDEAIADWLESCQVDLVVLAGYMQLLSPKFISQFRNRVINVHPALLPSFPGINSIDRALAHGVKLIGVTVHFVDEGVDSGSIILQEGLPVSYPADRDAVEEQIHAIEHRLLTHAIDLIAAEKVRFEDGNERVVVVSS